MNEILCEKCSKVKIDADKVMSIKFSFVHLFVKNLGYFYFCANEFEKLGDGLMFRCFGDEEFSYEISFCGVRAIASKSFYFKMCDECRKGIIMDARVLFEKMIDRINKINIKSEKKKNWFFDLL